jgi:class 3 adenylate cyclase
MRFWDLSGADVEAADAEPWDMPLAGAMRPFSVRSLVRLSLGGALLYLGTGTTGLALALAVGSGASHPDSWVAFQVTAILLGTSIVLLALVLSPHQFRRSVPAIAVVLLEVTPLLAAWLVGSAGPGFSIVSLGYVQAPLLAVYMLRPAWAVAQAALVVGSFGVLMALQDVWVEPGWMWLFLAGNVIVTGVVVGQIAVRADELAASEHEARVDLADLNHTLEDRVESQVTEIERLGGLRRFLSPQVADLVLAGDSAELARAHRARIAVFFCDLRGFTAFTKKAEPEEVLGVLEAYYGAVGGLLQRYDATVGDYAGDGIMAYFGDPVARDDAALAAVAMTREVTAAMAGVVADWNRRGYALDYGVGIAYGYATLGVVGFDGRYDYKPVGGVVNLAARLCAKAGAGQALLDHATFAATSEQFPSTPVADLELKGYVGETRAYALGQ